MSVQRDINKARVQFPSLESEVASSLSSSLVFGTSSPCVCVLLSIVIVVVVMRLENLLSKFLLSLVDICV